MTLLVAITIPLAFIAIAFTILYVYFREEEPAPPHIPIHLTRPIDLIPTPSPPENNLWIRITDGFLPIDWVLADEFDIPDWDALAHTEYSPEMDYLPGGPPPNVCWTPSDDDYDSVPLRQLGYYSLEPDTPWQEYPIYEPDDPPGEPSGTIPIVNSWPPSWEAPEAQEPILITPEPQEPISEEDSIKALREALNEIHLSQDEVEQACKYFNPKETP